MLQYNERDKRMHNFNDRFGIIIEILIHTILSYAYFVVARITCGSANTRDSQDFCCECV